MHATGVRLPIRLPSYTAGQQFRNYTEHIYTRIYTLAIINHQCNLQRVKAILGTSRSRMQQPIAACTRAQTLTRPCPCATCIWLLHPVPTSAQDGLDSPQLALVCFSVIIYCKDLICTCSGHQLQLALVVFILHLQLVHLLMCTHDL